MATVRILLVAKPAGRAFFALAALPLLQLSAWRFSRRMFPIGMAQQEALASYSAVVEESITGVRVVKGFAAEPRQVARLDVEAERVYERSIAAAKLRAWF